MVYFLVSWQCIFSDLIIIIIILYCPGFTAHYRLCRSLDLSADSEDVEAPLQAYGLFFRIWDIPATVCLMLYSQLQAIYIWQWQFVSLFWGQEGRNTTKVTDERKLEPAMIMHQQLNWEWVSWNNDIVQYTKCKSAISRTSQPTSDAQVSKL